MFQPATLTISPFAISPPDSSHVLPKVLKPKPVACVISRLPADALPAGQDSAVPSNFPSGVRIYNSRPDTIGLRPGTMSAVSLQFDAIASYRNPYLFTDTVDYSPEGSSRFGVAADPVPYTIAADDIITALLVGCFLIAAVEGLPP